MTKIASLLAIALLGSACTSVPMTVTRVSQYDAAGNLIGYEVRETMPITAVVPGFDGVAANVTPENFQSYGGAAAWPPNGSASAPKARPAVIAERLKGCAKLPRRDQASCNHAARTHP